MKFGTLIEKGQRLLASEMAYAVWAGVCTLVAMRHFYGSMFAHTGGAWSAPLDDVFIHFNFARSLKDGFPFEWLPGNGYSSGNTSILYPFLLALGYLFGHTDVTLVRWAAWIGSFALFATWLLLRRVVSLLGTEGSPAMRPQKWGALVAWLIPPVALSVGGLDWHLFSGMELSLFLALWSWSLLELLHFDRVRHTSRARRHAWRLGLIGTLLVLTRPEATTTVLLYGIIAFLRTRRTIGNFRAFKLLFAIGLPGAAAVITMAIVNRVLTGDTSPAGAIVKLTIANPILTPEEKLTDYFFLFRYTVWRNLERHLGHDRLLSLAFPFLAIVSLTFARTRKIAVVLLAQLFLWCCVVAFNQEVKYQNERYTMPAIAFLLVLATLGFGALLEKRSAAYRPFAIGAALLLLGPYAVEHLWGLRKYLHLAESARPKEWWSLIDPLPEHFYAEWLVLGFALLVLIWPLRFRAARIAVAVSALGVALFNQAPVFREQTWFFGKACKNIRDQHFTSAKVLSEIKPNRILIGDAGALAFFSRVPALDIVGLGGYHRLPFARARVEGLGAQLELIDRIPAADRPDLMVIYPSWWSFLPAWFSDKELLRVPAEGNVICGDYEDVFFRADWRKLGLGAPSRIPESEKVIDEIDVGDLVSERAHNYTFPKPALSIWPERATTFDIRVGPIGGASFFDAGRTIWAGRREQFTAHHLSAEKPAHLILRTGPTGSSRVEVTASGITKSISVLSTDHWVEEIIELPPVSSGSDLPIDISNWGPEPFVDYHVWITQ